MPKTKRGRVNKTSSNYNPGRGEQESNTSTIGSGAGVGGKHKKKEKGKKQLETSTTDVNVENMEKDMMSEEEEEEPLLSRVRDIRNGGTSLVTNPQDGPESISSARTIPENSELPMSVNNVRNSYSNMVSSSNPTPLDIPSSRLVNPPVASDISERLALLEEMQRKLATSLNVVSAPINRNLDAFSPIQVPEANQPRDETRDVSSHQHMLQGTHRAPPVIPGPAKQLGSMRQSPNGLVESAPPRREKS